MTISRSKAVEKASKVPITEALKRLKQNQFTDSLLIGERNRYVKNTAERVDDDLSANGSINEAQLSEYLAVSSLNHYFDGWSYLSRAFGCLIDGNIPHSVHLAYYAELRAVKSFLATQGLANFRFRNIGKDSNGDTFETSKGKTHDAIPDLIQKWATNRNTSIKLLEILEFSNRDFKGWLRVAGQQAGDGTIQQIAEDWLDCWSIDLTEITADKDLRNRVSYNPQRMREPYYDFEQSNFPELLIEFWEAFEPSETANFYKLDAHLLREALKDYYQAKDPERVSYKQFVKELFDQIDVSKNSFIGRFIIEDEGPKHPILREAEKNNTASNGEIRPLPVVSRGILLLRLAAASCENLLKQADVSNSDLDFWWCDFGEDLGFWKSNEYPNDLRDLWADIDLCIEKVDQWCGKTEQENRNVHDFLVDNSNSVLQLRQLQRAGLWGIGL